MGNAFDELLKAVLQISVADAVNAESGEFPPAPPEAVLEVSALQFGDIRAVFNRRWRHANIAWGKGSSDAKSVRRRGKNAGGDVHPGICIQHDSLDQAVCAFGTSKIRRNDPDNPRYFHVQGRQYPFLKKDTLFLLDSSTAVTWHDISFSGAYNGSLDAIDKERLAESLRAWRNDRYGK